MWNCLRTWWGYFLFWIERQRWRFIYTQKESTTTFLCSREDIKLPMELKIKCMFVESNNIMNIVQRRRRLRWSKMRCMMWWGDCFALSFYVGIRTSWCAMGRKIEKDLWCTYVSIQIHSFTKEGRWGEKSKQDKMMMGVD